MSAPFRPGWFRIPVPGGHLIRYVEMDHEMSLPRCPWVSWHLTRDTAGNTHKAERCMPLEEFERYGAERIETGASDAA